MRWSVLCFVAMFLLGGCNGNVLGSCNLSGSYEVTCTGESLTATGVLEVLDGEYRFTVTTPETLVGAVYTLSGDTVTLTKEGITCAVPDSAWGSVLLYVISEAQGQPMSEGITTAHGTLTMDGNGNPASLQTADFYAEFTVFSQ